jgi:hypothetical protein
MDTTAKVDIRKLQLLNDRIAQTIEALNQVRLSVHGLGVSQMGGNVQGFGAGQQGGVQGLGFGGGQQGGVGFGGGQQGGGFQGGQGIPGGQQMYGWGGMVPGMVPGMSHSSPYGYGQGFGFPQGQGFGQQGQGFGQQQVNPLLLQLLSQQGMGGGLSHSSEMWGGSGMQGMGYPQGGIGHQQGIGQQGIGQQGMGLDPFTVSRIMQMFPFAQMPVSPIQ